MRQVYRIRCLLTALLAGFLVLFASSLEALAYRIAIFDYEQRTEEQETFAKYSERRLREEFGALEVDQYCGAGNPSVSIDILKKLDSVGYDLLITITSDALLLANHFVHRTPTLYTNVNNPLFLGMETLGPPGGNISGASYHVPVRKQLSLFKTIQPSLKRVGFIFDETNKSRKVELRESRDACEELGLEYEIELIAERGELRGAAQRLIERSVDAVVVTSSDRIYKNTAHFIKVCDKAGVPVYSFNMEGVRLGALAALGSTYPLMFDTLIIPMASKVLKEGISPGTLPAAFLRENLLFLNVSKAAQLKMEIPDSVLRQAHEMY